MSVGVDLGAGGGWFDSHCHLQDQYRPQDTEVLAALGEAAAAGVGGVVCVGTDATTSRQAVELVTAVRAAVGDGAHDTGAPDEALPADFGVWATMGVHPHEAVHGVAGLEDELAETLRGAPGVVVAVGECGLDLHYDHSPRDAQRAVFAAQVALARRFDLTLVVHTRQAWDDTLDVLRSEGPPQRTVLHCFTGGPDEARRCLDLGAFLSFSGIVTFKGATDVRDAAVLCPADRLLVETDAPFLAPVPHRGKQNRPAWVVAVGEAVAEVRGVAPTELARTSTAATRVAFALG
jgi:TatD DNase family protein